MSITSSHTSKHEPAELYALNFKKIELGCANWWFGSTNLAKGTSPKNIVIDESEPFHFVQILFMIKESSWQDNKWMIFTKQGLATIVKTDEHVYLQHPAMFGKPFVDEFPNQIRLFIRNYCDVVGKY